MNLTCLQKLPHRFYTAKTPRNKDKLRYVVFALLPCKVSLHTYRSNISLFSCDIANGMCFATLALTHFGQELFFTIHDNSTNQILWLLALAGGGELYGVPEKKSKKIRN